ncbi:MAG: hypothetical protein WD045_02050 [Pirellulaceae bacterium]
MSKFMLSLSLAAVLGMVAVSQAEEPKCGLAEGAQPPAFVVTDVTGPEKGKDLCYRCKYGGRPTVAVFARQLDENVASLIQQLDAAVAKNSDKKMSAFLVMMSDNPEDHKSSLEKLATTRKIGDTPLTLFKDSQGPEGYNVSKEASVSVMMWTADGVKVNHSFPAGKLTKEEVAKVVADTNKILN